MIKLFETDPDPKPTALYQIRYKVSYFNSSQTQLFIGKSAFVLATSPKEAKTFVADKNITSVCKHKNTDIAQILMTNYVPIHENIAVKYIYNSVSEWKDILGHNFRGLVHFGEWVQML